jgi:hypothetical protein
MDGVKATCHTCFLDFANVPQYIEHVVSAIEHRATSYNYCQLCNKVYGDAAQYVQHLRDSGVHLIKPAAVEFRTTQPGKRFPARPSILTKSSIEPNGMVSSPFNPDTSSGTLKWVYVNRLGMAPYSCAIAAHPDKTTEDEPVVIELEKITTEELDDEVNKLVSPLIEHAEFDIKKKLKKNPNLDVNEHLDKYSESFHRILVRGDSVLLPGKLCLGWTAEGGVTACWVFEDEIAGERQAMGDNGNAFELVSQDEIIEQHEAMEDSGVAFDWVFEAMENVDDQLNIICRQTTDITLAGLLAENESSQYNNAAALACGTCEMFFLDELERELHVLDCAIDCDF